MLTINSTRKTILFCHVNLKALNALIVRKTAMTTIGRASLVAHNITGDAWLYNSAPDRQTAEHSNQKSVLIKIILMLAHHFLYIKLLLLKPIIKFKLFYAYIKRSLVLYTIQLLLIQPASLNYNTTSVFMLGCFSVQIVTGIFLVCFIVLMHISFS